jgi:hypothetical protein
MGSRPNAASFCRDLFAPVQPVPENANSTADMETARVRFALLAIGIVLAEVVAAQTGFALFE